MKRTDISELYKKARELRKMYRTIHKEADGFLNSHDVFSMEDVKNYDDPRLKEINAALKDKTVSQEAKKIYEEEKAWLLKKQVDILSHCLDGFRPDSPDVLVFCLLDEMEIYDPQNFVHHIDPHHPVNGLKKFVFEEDDSVNHVPLDICGSSYTVWYTAESFNAYDEDVGTICVDDEDGRAMFLDEFFAITGAYDKETDTIAPMTLDDLKQVYIFVSRNGEEVDRSDLSRYSWKKLLEDDDIDMDDVEW